MGNEPNGKLYQLCGPENLIRNFCRTNPTASCTNCVGSKTRHVFSAERTQRQAVPIVLARKRATHFCRTNPTASCADFAAAKSTRAFFAKRTQRQAVPILRPRKALAHFLRNEPNGKLYRFWSPENGSRNFCRTNPTANCAGFGPPKMARAISAERTQRQTVPILDPRKWLAQFLPNEPNGKLCRFCRSQKHACEFLRNEPNGKLCRF